MQVDWQRSNAKSSYRGTADTAVETGPGKGKAAMLDPDRRGNRGGSNVTFLLQANQCRKTKMRQEKRLNPQG